MRTSRNLRFVVTNFLFLLSLDFGKSEISFEGSTVRKTSRSLVDDSRTNNVTPMHKVLMTQRGYIQFLRWELPVPEIEEFTFCLWVKSTNLTYPHSIFSYSKHEKDRLVRAWISPQGQSIHLEIDNVEIFAHPSYIEEHRWYHICQSWENSEGRFALWVNGHKEIDGYADEMAGHVIPSDGDIVVGQEYTDFDKGLEDGIEGAVLGFNLLLSSAFPSSRPFFERNKLDEAKISSESDLGFESVPIYDSENYRLLRSTPFYVRVPGEKSQIRSRRSTDLASRIRENPSDSRAKRKSSFFGDSLYKNPGKPLGQQLVDITFRHCKQGRGSPRIGGESMLISWTRTPVKVFGGAIVKNAKSACGNFG